jgi:hypothetical protein
MKTMTVNVKNSTDINEQGISAKIYPNPTHDIVNIEAESLQRLTITNALGQILYDVEVDSDKAQVDMSQFGTGIFLIRIYTENGIIAKRINVIR